MEHIIKREATDLDEGTVISAFNYDKAITDLIADNGSVKKKFTFSELSQLKRSAIDVCRHLKSQVHARVNLVTPEELKKVGTLLIGLHSLDTLEELRDVQKNLTVNGVLNMISNPSHHLPKTLQDIAAAMHTKFEAQSWGETVVEPAISIRKRKTEPSNDTDNENPKAKHPNKGIVKSARPPISPPPKDHPIFGLEGVMHHIVITTVKIPAYSINPAYLKNKKSASVYGDNGFSTGECWPYQITALRDGVHGQKEGGICGSDSGGAYSIVVGGKLYEDLDKDEGDIIWYSAPAAFDTYAKEPDTTKPQVKYLLKSIETKNPVRVIRNASGKKKWSGYPKMGLRYDGLYQVLKVERKTNTKGGVFASFLLVRIKDQAPIDVDKPSKEQMAEYQQIKAGY